MCNVAVGYNNYDLAAITAAGVMATNTSQRQMRRTARKIAKGAEHAVSQLDKMVGDFVERKMEG